jgi:DNA (cytosine-5)-methyltransferase 1
MDNRQYKVLSLFSGAGGLDLGFEAQGFQHLECVEFDDHCVATLAKNRPDWKIIHGDIRTYFPAFKDVDVLIGGPPCQGFSLGGNRDENDPRNSLFLEMVRITEQLQPKVVVIENVLNLRTMKAPWSGRNFADEIASQFESIGYSVTHDIFKVCYFGVPQTRRRFVFVAIRGSAPEGYELPVPDVNPATIRKALFELGRDDQIRLPNHAPLWGFKSRVHTSLGKDLCGMKFDSVPFRISRTGSDGHPIRSFDEPFPAVDTATVWGWARGAVHAERLDKDRKNEKHIRNPEATIKLWRIVADQMRTFTHREYARLQTFPDDWVFIGGNKRDIHKQVGNAVPVAFAERIASNVRTLLDCLTDGRAFPRQNALQLQLI